MTDSNIKPLFVHIVILALRQSSDQRVEALMRSKITEGLLVAKTLERAILDQGTVVRQLVPPFMAIAASLVKNYQEDVRQIGGLIYRLLFLAFRDNYHRQEYCFILSRWRTCFVVMHDLMASSLSTSALHTITTTYLKRDPRGFAGLHGQLLSLGGHGGPAGAGGAGGGRHARDPPVCLIYRDVAGLPWLIQRPPAAPGAIGRHHRPLQLDPCCLNVCL
eukprot:scaffold130748_cov32-Prasinocladus_malaysianus.AAC.1